MSKRCRFQILTNNKKRYCKNNKCNDQDYCTLHLKIINNNVNSLDENNDSNDSSDSNESYDPNWDDFGIGQCCFCGNECNPCSQSCGRCSRKLIYFS